MRWSILFLVMVVSACMKTNAPLTIENRLEDELEAKASLATIRKAVITVWYGWDDPYTRSTRWYPVVGIVSARETVITSYPPFALGWLTANELDTPAHVYVTPLDGNTAVKQPRWAGTFKGVRGGIATVSVPGLPHPPASWAYAPEKHVGRYVLAIEGKGLTQRSKAWPPRVSVTPIAYQRSVDYGDRSCVIGIRYFTEPRGEAFAAFDAHHGLIGLIDGGVAYLPDLKQRDPNIPHDRDWSSSGFYVCLSIP